MHQTLTRYTRLAGLGLAALLLLARPAGAASESASTVWQYGSEADAMRQTALPNAQIRSLNSFQISAHTQPITLLIGIVNAGGTLGSGIIVSEGKLDCPLKTGCQVSVSFDKGPVVQFDARRTHVEEYSTLVVSPGNDWFARELAQSRSAIVEVAFEKYGAKQFSFNTAGLDLSRLGPATPMVDRQTTMLKHTEATKQIMEEEKQLRDEIEASSRAMGIHTGLPSGDPAPDPTPIPAPPPP